MDECRPKEMFSVMPVIKAKAKMVQPEGKEEKGVYKCPIYKTIERFRTFVAVASLKTRHDTKKWVLAGVAVILDVEGVSDEKPKK